MDHPDRDPFDRTRRTFTDLIAEHGYTIEGLDYAGHEGQRRRFEVLTGGIDLDGASVLDVGCGFGELADFLEERGGAVQYHGIDITPASIDGARARRPDLDVRVANVLELPAEPTYDVVVANGIFYLVDAADPAEVMAELVAKMWSLTTGSLAFTSLSAWGPAGGDADEFHADPAEVLDRCRQLTPWVSLRHDYHVRDFAVFLHRTARR